MNVELTRMLGENRVIRPVRKRMPLTISVKDTSGEAV